jgi:hypothetical protein
MSFAIDPALAGPSTSRNASFDYASSARESSNEYTSEEELDESEETDAEDEYEDEYGAAGPSRDRAKARSAKDRDIEIPVRFRIYEQNST